MSEPRGFLDAVMGAVLDAVRPLEDALSDEILFGELMTELGWAVPDEIDMDLVAGYVPLAGPLAAAQQLLEAVRDPDADADPPALVEAVEGLVTGLGDFASSPPPPELPGPLATPYFWLNVAAELVDYLLIDWLRHRKPVVLAVLRLLGIVDDEPQSVSVPEQIEGHRRLVVRWDRIPRFVSDPSALPAEVYGWGHTFQHRRLLVLAEEVLWLVGLTANRALPGTEALDAHYGAGAPGPPDLSELRIRLYEGRSEAAFIELGIAVLPIPEVPTAGLPPTGLMVGPYAAGGVFAEREVVDDLWVRFGGAVDASGAVGVRVWPGKVDGFADAGAVAGDLRVELSWEPGEARPLFGAREGTRATIGRAALGVELRGSVSDPELRLLAAFEPLTITLDLSDADAFLSSFLGEAEREATLAGALIWSSKWGLTLEGSGRLQATIPLNLALGGIKLVAIALAAETTDDGLDVSAGLIGALSLGPVHASVDRVGATLQLAPTPGGAVAGLDTRLSFKPPTGAGLSIDGGAVTGGGFLSFDPRQDQYAGVLHLEFGQVTLNAIGLLTTRLPDGSRGFSLLVIVQASGFTPVQLGFGFALTGVGGLLGINRTVAVDVLRAGVRTRALDSIMFMREDPVPRAPQIVSTLQSVFPPARGRFVFGPMVQLAWGTPALVTAEIALVLELPAPLRLIVLGRLRSLLPTPEAAVVKLQLDAVGVLDFDRREVSVDATLVDSTVGPFALSGDMALRASWGERPDFALSIGGFHPAYKPPPGFPALRRLTLALSSGDNPRLRAETYLAITANTVQVGAALDLRVEAAGFALEGGMGFDALVTLSPFGFQVDIAAYLALKRGSRTLMGIDLRAHLTGPNPWHVNGEVTFKILFLKVTIRVDATFGDSRALPEVQRVAIWPKLKAALQTAGNWAAELPSDAGRLAVLQPPSPTAGEAIVHPLGTVRVTQRVVPLERTIARFGAAPPADYTRFTIASATGAKRDAASLYESFSPAQFFDLSDAEKLAAPGFEPMPAGARFRAPENAQAVGPTAPCPLSYETIVDGGPAQGVPFEPDTSTVGQQAEQGPAAGAETRTTGRLKYAVDTPPPKTADPTYGVAGIEVLKAAPDVETDGTYSAALETARERRDLQIVRKEELVPA